MKADGGRESAGRAEGAGANAPDAGGQAPAAGAPAPAPDRNAPFRSTLARVLLVQILALIALWLLQATYHS